MAGADMKKTIAVLYGGRSGEHDVSRVSAASVARNLDRNKYDVLLVGIAMDGAWYLQDASELERCIAGAPALGLAEASGTRVAVVPGGGASGALVRSGTRSGAAPLPVDVIFPVLHGTFGEDGTLQGLLEMARLPYVGAGVLGSAVGMDKEKAKALWIQAGLPTVPYIAIRKSEWASRDKKTALLERAERDFLYPLFVKPACAGSSVGAGKANDRAALELAGDEAFAWDDKILVEPFVLAREVECSVCGNEKIEAYTPGEVIPTHEFYDYDAKYIDPEGAALLIPAEMDEAGLRTVREIAIRAYRVAELSGLARVDFFVRKDTGAILLNEVNTMPGFTTISMFPKMCEASGLAYGPLLDKLVLLAEERFRGRDSRDYARTGAGADAGTVAVAGAGTGAAGNQDAAQDAVT
ncbi:MAG: D-alanine--D-alanine ligase A [Treponema sp. GWA1_62_8]|nr:MAG: D-alanine--D-alanine ligase A [Treponema sp. GWA1_62_8]